MFMLIYLILFAEVKQQNLTDNNLLNLIRFGQVNENCCTRIENVVIGRNVALENGRNVALEMAEI